MNFIEESKKEKIHQNIFKSFEAMDPLYLKSKDFKLFLDVISNRIRDDSSNIYVHVLELRNELKAHKHYSFSSSKKSSTAVASTADVAESTIASKSGSRSVDERRIVQLEKIMKVIFETIFSNKY